MIFSKIKWISYGETWKVEFPKKQSYIYPKVLSLF